MTTGTIKTMLTDKGFGFITPDDSSGDNDVFFHRSSVADDAFDMLRVGQNVSFNVEPDTRNPQRSRATQVTPAS